MRFICGFFKGAYCFLRDGYAATAIEYTLIACGIALAIAAVVFALGDQLHNLIASLMQALPTG